MHGFLVIVGIAGAVLVALALVLGAAKYLDRLGREQEWY